MFFRRFRLSAGTWELISFNRDDVWPSEPLQQRVQPCEICALRSYVLEQILR